MASLLQLDKTSRTKKQKRSEIIFGFLSVILFFILVAGDIMSALAGMATIGHIVALLGTVGDTAYDSHTHREGSCQCTSRYLWADSCSLGVGGYFGSCECGETCERYDISRFAEAGNKCREETGLFAESYKSLQEVKKRV
jgi:hypothetical protein